MAMTPEQVTLRVALFVQAIRCSISHSLVEHHAAQALEYIEHAHEQGIINAMRFDVLVMAVNDAADARQAKVDKDGGRRRRHNRANDNGVYVKCLLLSGG